MVQMEGWNTRKMIEERKKDRARGKEKEKKRKGELKQENELLFARGTLHCGSWSPSLWRIAGRYFSI